MDTRKSDAYTPQGASEMNKEFEADLQELELTASDLNRFLCDETLSYIDRRKTEYGT